MKYFSRGLNKRRVRVVRFGITFSLLLLIAGTFAAVTISRTSGRLLFKRLVVSPIPESVQEIRADRRQISSLVERLDGFRERAFVLRFKVDKEDLARIIAVRGFKPWESVKYSEGNLRYKSSDQFLTYIELYAPEHRAPSWFDFEEWAEFETYFVGKDKTGLLVVDVSLLLYSEQRGSAYLIKWEMSF